MVESPPNWPKGMAEPPPLAEIGGGLATPKSLGMVRRPRDGYAPPPLANMGVV